jgi:molybdopterin/thiamine biosynthesis adenylyltransferase
MHRPDPDPLLPPLSDAEHARYEWQLPVEGFGEISQRRLKAASVLVSRVGGLGGVVAHQLAAAGIGRLVLAHGGLLRPSDLNRQLLMHDGALGQPRVETARARLAAFNPHVRIEATPENVTEANARALVAQADVVVDCAPLFAERYLLNREAVAQRKPMVECAVFDLECHLTTFVPGETACLRCLYPQPSATWTRRFPVLGAVPGTAGALAALEVIKLLTGLAPTLAGHLLVLDLRSLEFRKLRVRRLPGCPDCGHL